MCSSPISRRDGPEHPGRPLAGPAEVLLDEGERRRGHGHRGGDAGKEQQAEPHHAGRGGHERPARDLVEHQRHGDEAEVEAPALGDGGRAGHAEEGDDGRDGQRAAQHHLGGLVGGRGGDAGQDEVVLLPSGSWRRPGATPSPPTG